MDSLNLEYSKLAKQSDYSKTYILSLENKLHEMQNLWHASREELATLQDEFHSKTQEFSDKMDAVRLLERKKMELEE